MALTEKGKQRRLNRATSTSADDLLKTASSLGQKHIGKIVTVMGRDVTLGKHDAEPILHVGVVEALHINAQRVRVVLVREGLRFNPTRVIEVTQ